MPLPPKPTPPNDDPLSTTDDPLELKIFEISTEEPSDGFRFDDELESDSLDDPLLLSTEEEPAAALPSLEPSYVELDDLADFSTQEVLPTLPWSLDADLLEKGLTVAAVLEPKLAQTLWEHPELPLHELSVSIRLKMLLVSVRVQIVRGEESLLRVGRDVLAGRALILVE